VKAATLEEIRTWPATVDVTEACRAWGISKSHGYELCARNEFPARVIRVGSRYRVITSSILAELGASREAA
jgi:predicted DNA-binding transcriptional regulator AlpA